MSDGWSPRVAVGLEAASVAMKAKCGELTQGDVDALREKAEQLLDRDDAIFRAITAFATGFMEHAGDAAQLAYLGRLLQDGVAFATGPAPAAPDWQRRADING